MFKHAIWAFLSLRMVNCLPCRANLPTKMSYALRLSLNADVRVDDALRGWDAFPNAGYRQDGVHVEDIKPQENIDMNTVP